MSEKKPEEEKKPADTFDKVLGDFSKVKDLPDALEQLGEFLKPIEEDKTNE